MKRIVLAVVLACNPVLAEPHDLKRLPLGDNLKSTAPEIGHLWPCRIDPQAGGAFNDGTWINKQAGTFDKTAKPQVPGDVKWPHNLTITVENGSRVFIGNDLPDHGTGVYPVNTETEAYKFDRNPNRIKAHKLSFSLPAEPKLAASPSCAPGAVGILLSGIPLFSAIDAPGRDAVAHEVQDKCDGHPQESGVYHYHNVSPCVADTRAADGASGLVGYAVDGFGIFGPYAIGGRKLDTKDLDECHGTTSEVPWDGRRVNIYHYVATDDFPYTVGCLKGTFEHKTVEMLSGSRGWFQ